MKKLIEYMPPFLKNVREFNKIFDSEDIELQNLEVNLKKLLTEVIVSTADSYGLDRYEKILKIKNDTNDINKRRFKILSRLNNQIPYSYNWLVEKLNTTIGKDNYKLNVNYDEYKVEIEVASLFEDIAEILNKDLKEQLPANLIISVNLFMTEEMQNNYAISMHSGDFIEIRQVI